jgi:acetyltransferase-like isoleucine patch superfamily enzyme
MLYKIKRKIYIKISPLLRLFFWIKDKSSLGETFFVGMPWISGMISIKSGVLVSTKFGNFLYQKQPVVIHAFGDAKVSIGANFKGGGFTLICTKQVFIGNNVMIAPEVLITDNNMHHIDPIARRNQTKLPDGKIIVIEDDVWICMRAIILPGSHIGKGSVIGAGQIIRGTIPPNSILRSTN